MTPTRLLPADLVDMARHAAAAQTLAARGEEGLARGAANLATVAAYRLAATPSGDADAFAAKVARLCDVAVDVEHERRGHVAGLIDAALAAETADRLALGLSPHDRRLDGWCRGAIASRATSRTPRGEPLEPLAPEVLARYAAARRLDDVDLVLARAIGTIHEMIALGGTTPAGLDQVEAEALSLCVWPTTSATERDDRRPALVILRRTLRRRRPLAAAIIGAQLRRDRGARTTTGL